MPINFLPCADAAALRAVIESWIAVDPVPFSLVCGIAELIGDDGWCGVMCTGNEPLLALACTPPKAVVIATPRPLDDAVVQAVAGFLVSRYPDTTGLDGPVAWTEAITAAIGRTVGSHLDLRLHRLVGVPRLPHPTEGVARPFRDLEAATIQAWCDGFSSDVGQPSAPTSIETACKLVPKALAWTVDDRPVAMATRKRPLQGGCTISGVYTPPAMRRRGYAGAVVHALCERLLAEGGTYVALFTDLANPTSNRLYARIGFQPVLDQRLVRWTASGGHP